MTNGIKTGLRRIHSLNNKLRLFLSAVYSCPKTSIIYNGDQEVSQGKSVERGGTHHVLSSTCDQVRLY